MQKKYKIGYTSGVFDMFHVGHLNILRKAKEQCELLVVGVSTDEVVESYKHKLPIIPFQARLAIVQAIRYVDEVIPQDTMDKMEMWNEVHFDVMFHGDEWKGTSLYNKYEEEFAKVGVKIEYLSHTEGISSTILRDRLNNQHKDE